MPICIPLTLDRREGDWFVFKIDDANVEFHVPAYLLPDAKPGVWKLVEDVEATEAQRRKVDELLKDLTEGVK